MADPIERDRAALKTIAQRAAETLASSTQGKPDPMPIETNIGSLRALSDVIGKLVAEVDRCGGSTALAAGRTG